LDIVKSMKIKAAQGQEDTMTPDEERMAEIYARMTQEVTTKHCFNSIFGVGGGSNVKLTKDQQRDRQEQYSMCLVKNRVFLNEAMMELERQESKQESEGIK
jgi:hypothetical protein